MGTTATITTIDDMFRPSYSDFRPVPPSPLQLQCGTYGTVDVLLHYYVNINDDNYNNATFAAMVLIGANSLSGVDGFSIRYTFEISSDNFATLAYTETVTTAITHYSGESMTWTYSSRDHSSYSGRLSYPYSTSYSNISGSLTLRNTAYKARIRAVQYREGNTWKNATGTQTTRVVNSYAPFTLAITKPSHFYLNGLNTFNATIESKFTSDTFMEVLYDGGSTSGATGLPVRNSTYPYITSGQQTSYLYCAGTTANGGITGNPTYRMSVWLKIADPSDNSTMITVSKTVVTGDAEYQQTDKKDYWTVSLSHVDDSGSYNRYGYLLHNIGAKLVSTASVSATYGVRSRIQQSVFSTSQSLVYITKWSGFEPHEEIMAQDIPANFGNRTFYTGIRVSGGYEDYFTQELVFSAPVWDYSIPSFPNLAVHRCNEDGSANDNGAYAKLEWSVAISSIANQNSKSLRISHSAGITEYNPLDSYTQNGVLVVPASTESAYTITFVVSDDLNSFQRHLPLSTAGVIMDWLYGGKGVSFGMVASRKNAVEISSDWDLVCSRMELAGMDVQLWMKEVLARVDGLEEFTSNIGSTDQYQVTFYNDDDLIKRHWIRSGEDAPDPVEEDPMLTPTREPTTTRTYSFAGWSRTKGSSTADPNALINIQSYRDIYAAFTSAVRHYSVFYFNKGELLQTITDLTYHSNSAAYTGQTPEDEAHGLFVGWMPSGKYIEENVSPIAQFYYDEEITDSWEEIVAACNNGSYVMKYKPGNWKMLDLGAQGNIKMRVKGLDLHRAPGMKKLPMSWEADTKLTSNHRINPAAESVVAADIRDGFVFSSQSGGGTSWYYNFKSAIKLGDSSDKAMGTIVLTTNASATVQISYWEVSVVTGQPVHFKMTVDGRSSVDEDDGVTQQNRKWADTINIDGADSITLEFEAYAPNGNFNNQQLAFEIRVVGGTLNVNPSTIAFSTNKVDGLRYTVGTGTIGGFEESELKKWLHDEIKPLFPEALRNGLRTVRLISPSVKPIADYPFYEFVPNAVAETDVFIPSAAEIIGNYEGNTEGINFDVQKYEYRRKTASGSNGYACRDARNSDSSFDYIYGSTSDTDGQAYRTSTNASNTQRIYICFCT